MLVMGALFEIAAHRIDGVYLSGFLFADDTLIFGAKTQCIDMPQRILWTEIKL